MSVELHQDSDPGFLYKKFQAANIDRPCMDVDQVILHRGGRPAAVFETTNCATYVENPKFLAGVDERLNQRNPQVCMLRQIADLLGVKGYVVAFALDFKHFAVRPLAGGEWHFADAQAYIAWVMSL